MFRPVLLANIQRWLPAALIERLDPFEASLQRFVAAVASETPSGSRVLDAGAGECRFKRLFDRADYVGMDSAEGNTAWDYSNLDVLGRLEELPFADASFDSVLCIVALEHTPDPQRALAEFCRVMMPRGSVHLVVPHMWEQHQRPHDYFRFTAHGIKILMERSGFQVKRVEPVGGFFWLLGRRLMGVLAFAQHGWRWILFPILGPVLGLILPFCFYYLDALDKDRDYTLGFICEGYRQQ